MLLAELRALEIRRGPTRPRIAAPQSQHDDLATALAAAVVQPPPKKKIYAA